MGDVTGPTVLAFLLQCNIYLAWVIQPAFCLYAKAHSSIHERSGGRCQSYYGALQYRLKREAAQGR